MAHREAHTLTAVMTCAGRTSVKPEQADRLQNSRNADAVRKSVCLGGFEHFPVLQFWPMKDPIIYIQQLVLL